MARANHVNFLFGIHCHQPVGNFDPVIEKIYGQSYLPFLDMLERYPAVRMVMHYSGPLLEWLQYHHPDYLDRLRALVAADRVEMMGSGFYEPVLPVLQPHDIRGQLGMMRDFLGHRLGAAMDGAWITERVWETPLAAPLADAGVRWITLDDFHFQLAGKHLEELYSHYATESGGRRVTVFPISQAMRYAVPFHDIPEIRPQFEAALAHGESPLLTLVDDGEKFGAWPGTHEWVYERGWLDRFFRFLTDNRHWIRMKLGRECMRDLPSGGLLYLPDASYFEMGIWAHNAELGSRLESLVRDAQRAGNVDDVKMTLNPASWRNFLVKYPESNHIHKRVYEISDIVRRLHERPGIDAGWLADIQKDVWRAQCNCAYWHGIFGGIYLGYLRNALYYHLLKAERGIHEIAPDLLKAAERKDLDFDGFDEISLRNRQMRVILSCRDGSLIEWDYLPSLVNFGNTFSKKTESYHTFFAVKEEGAPDEGHATIHEQVKHISPAMRRHLTPDAGRRPVLTERFFAEAPALDALTDNTVMPLPATCSERQSECWESSGMAFGRFDTRITLPAGDSLLCRTEAQLDQVQNRLRVKKQYRNDQTRALHLRLGLEVGLALPWDQDPDRHWLLRGLPVLPRESFHEAELQSIQARLLPERASVHVAVSEASECFSYPVRTVSQSDGGVDLHYQSSVLLWVYERTIVPGESWSLHIDFTIHSLENG